MKVNVSYDTVDKSLIVELDGSIVEDVTEIEFNSIWSMDENEYSDAYRMCVTSVKKNDDGTAEMYRVCASEAGEVVPYVEETSKADLAKEQIAKIFKA